MERLLQNGWPTRADRAIDGGTYRALLRDIETPAVVDALRTMVGVVKHRPTASEIAAAVHVATPQPASPEMIVEGERLLAVLRDDVGDLIFGRWLSAAHPHMLSGQLVLGMPREVLSWVRRRLAAPIARAAVTVIACDCDRTAG